MAVCTAVLCVLLDPGEQSQALKSITSPISLPLGTTTLQGLCMEHCLISCAAVPPLDPQLVAPLSSSFAPDPWRYSSHVVQGLTIKYANLFQGCH